MYSEKQARDLGIYKNKDDDLRMLRFNPIAILLILFGVFAELWLIVKYDNSEPYWIWCIILLSIGLAGLFGGIALNGFKVQTQYDYLNSDLTSKRNIAAWNAFFFLTVLGIEIVLYLVKATLKYSLGLTEMYFYYIAAAVMEELFFRYFLTSALYLKLKLPKIVCALISAVPFMLIHFAVYGTSLSMMVVMYFGGVVFAYTFLIHKDISINISAHSFINIITLILTTQNLVIAT